MLKELVGTYQVIKGTEYLFSPPREVVGKCPRCGGEVAETQKGFFCQDNSCKFAIWKNSKWWAAKKQQPTKAIVAALLKDGRAHVTGLYSEKTGKTYDAAVVLEDTGQYVNFNMGCRWWSLDRTRARAILSAVPLPSTESMKTELVALAGKKDTLLAEYRAARNQAQEYETIKKNVDALLSVTKKQTKEKSLEME